MKFIGGGKQSNSEVITYMNILNEKVKNSFSVYAGHDEEDLIAHITKHDGKFHHSIKQKEDNFYFLKI